ncbi:helix-turn-helix domain-containing protein [Saccharicrinis fermentans]|uniref:Uncharacterized protein n=1 Tax=Saccharicrinis fermentans DSM 9555 = JCM 21142 TaxID=869213 RepID=W7YDE0_9BACT|nr:helix-turn-helix domain-containing protein [Saccharicrinis fermentans]GAF02501.1 hypothetical protein JCM21142_31139 [Saccharicrinis fermentans DSM 9555 = JCM 21142]
MIPDNKKQVIEEALKRICGHKLFVHSPTYIDLLKYLVVKTLNNEELNEVTIGSDLYGIDYSLNKSNSTVRSYIHKLRKKLADYYNEVGANETVVFQIAKGQYNLSFLSSHEYLKTKRSEISTVTIPIKYFKLSGGFVLLFIIAFCCIKTYVSKPCLVWKNFFDPNAQNLLVISDQFVVSQRFEDGRYYGVSYPEVNSNDDFIEYTQAHPQKKIKTTDYTLMTKMAPYTVKSLSLWFQSYKSDFNLGLESQMKYEDVTKYNIVFVGQYKTMNLSRTLFLKNSKVFTTFDDGFMYKNGRIEKIYNTQYGGNHKVEYAMVSYTSFASGKSALYFVSNNDIGVLSTVRNFTDKAWLTKFQKQIGSEAKYFNALFEVSGLQRTDVSCKLVELEVL